MNDSPRVTQHLHKGKLSPDCQARVPTVTAPFSLTSTILGSRPTFLRLQGMCLITTHLEQHIFYPQQYLHQLVSSPSSSPTFGSSCTTLHR